MTYVLCFLFRLPRPFFCISTTTSSFFREALDRKKDDVQNGHNITEIAQHLPEPQGALRRDLIFVFRTERPLLAKGSRKREEKY